MGSSKKSIFDEPAASIFDEQEESSIFDDTDREGIIDRTPILTAKPIVPSPPSWYERVASLIAKPFEMIGEDVILQAEVQKAAGEKAREIAVKTAKAIDTPWNAIRVGFYNNAVKGSRSIRLEMVPFSTAYKELPGFIQGLRDGWSGKEYKDWTDISDVTFLGVEGEQKLNEWIDRHTSLKVMSTARDFATEIIIESAVEMALFGLAFTKPLRAVGRRLPLIPKAVAKVSPRQYVRVFGKDMLLPNPKVANKGLTPWLEAMMKRNLPTGISLDDALLWNMVKESPEEFVGRGLAKVPREALGAPPLSNLAEQIAKTKEQGLNLLDQFSKLKLSLANDVDPAIRQADEVIGSIWDAASPKQLDVAYDRLAGLKLTREHLTEQIGNVSKRLDVVDSKLKTMQSDFAVGRDWTAVSRTVRTEFLHAKRAAFAGTAKEFDDILRKAADSISAGRIARYAGLTAKEYAAMDVGEVLNLLSKTELLAITDYIEILIKTEAAFKFQKYVQPVIRGKKLFKPKGVAARFFSFVPPGEYWATPAWQWYNRKGAKRVFQTFDSADTLATQMGIHYTDMWEEALETLGKNAAKDKESMQRVFWAANGQFTKVDNAYKRAVQAGDTVLAKKITQEKVVGEKANAMFSEVWDLLEAKGLIPPGVRKETYYIKNIIDSTVLKAAGKNVAKQAEVIGPMLRYYQKYAKEGIDINEMINRVRHNLPIMENADAGFRAGMHNEIRKLHWEPAITQGKTLAEFTGDPEIIEYTADLINFAIRGQVTPLERRVEGMFETLGRALEYGSKAIPGYTFKTQERAAKQILGGARRLTYHGALWMNPGPVVKNATQTLLNIPQTGYKSWWWGARSLFTEGGQELANKWCRLLPGRIPLESFDIRTMKGFSEWGHKAFRFIDRVPNVKLGYNDACHWLITRNEDYINIVKKYGKFGTGNIDESARTISKTFDAGELLHVDELANQMVKTNQYGYRKIDMPMYMIRGGPVAKSMLQFSTWPANYFYSYLPELAKASFSGVGPGGIKLAMKERMALLKHYGNAIVLIEAGKAMGVDLAHTMPPTPQTGFPFVKAQQAPYGMGPAGEFFAGVFQAGLGGMNDDERAVSKGLARARRSVTFAPPLAFRRLDAVASGEKGLPALFGFKELEKEEFTLPPQLRPQRPRR